MKERAGFARLNLAPRFGVGYGSGYVFTSETAGHSPYNVLLARTDLY